MSLIPPIQQCFSSPYDKTAAPVNCLLQMQASTVTEATITTKTRAAKTKTLQNINAANHGLNQDQQQQEHQHPYPLRPCYCCCRSHHHHHHYHQPPQNHQQQQQRNIATITTSTAATAFSTANNNNNSVASKCCWRHGFSWLLSSLFAAPLLTSLLSPPSSLFAGNKVRQRYSTADGVGGGTGGGGSKTFAFRLASLQKLHFVIFLLFNLLLRTCCGQLLINVQNQGGEVIQESITSNVSEDLITLEFQKSDGTLITQVIDFRNEVRILKALVLGEEERGQNLYQVMCFVTKFNKGDFISSDAMAKLRQKNPSTIRTPEEDKGKDTFTMTSWVHLNRSQPISRHLVTLCNEALDATYVRDVDLKAWSELPGSSISSLEAATEKFPDTLSSRCNEVSSLWAPCICTLETCIGWYPCGLKYCKGKNGGDNSAAAAASNYRCGIKTCRKCSLFSYYVRQKQQCLWDE
ncbi:out at first protein [Musca vetustissima]|uniref:out at first protein n=1 Tax=Musca vetustissima TaxID=27455 RepID=UPI002AB7C6AE|nr:out at first protein [Musca vetustissima]